MYKAVFSKTDSISGSGTGLQSLQISYVNGAGLNSPSTCPTGFIAVPGNSEFNQPGFCVAKYEMSYGDADTPNTCDGTCPVAENTVNQTDWNTIAYVA